MRFVRLLLLSLALLLPVASQAAPITFGVTRGSVSTRVWLNGQTVARGTGHLTNSFVVFDDATGNILDFTLESTDAFIWAPVLPGAYNAIDLDLLITPGAGYASTATGSNPYDVTLGPIDIAFTGTVLDLSPPVTEPPVPGSGVLPLPAFTVTATYDAGEMRLSLVGVKVGEIRFGHLVFDVRADVEFFGVAAPEPAVASLLIAALAGLALVRSRR